MRGLVRFEVFMAVRMMMFFWVLAPCRSVGRCQRFGETMTTYTGNLLTILHGAKTQRKNIIIIIILTAVKISNLT
jgi:hypothetical protein